MKKSLWKLLIKTQIRMRAQCVPTLDEYLQSLIVTGFMKTDPYHTKSEIHLFPNIKATL